MPSNLEFGFPIQGISKAWPTNKQPPLTSFDMDNVVPIDADKKRLRGGQRWGLKKWGDGDQIGASSQPVVALCHVAAVV
ncbi:MAG: hypothetical protein M0Q27_03205 [Candidatus Colwellbacteria bacterium]|nr:hypothetical protein [Candidatus Colwellbacteria bacterium]